MTQKPVFDRDAQGRHKVDLQQIRSPILRYGLAVGVVVAVVGAAWWAGRGSTQESYDYSWLVPWLGGGLLALIGIGLLLRGLGGKR